MTEALRDKRATYILMLCVFVVAAWLRFYHLGLPALERNQDEDIMATAVMGILEHGYPLMPGGMIYLRAAPLLYAMAGSVELFGLTEFALRLPATLFGLLLVPLSYFVTRRYFGEACALAAAVLIALSYWEVDVSRTARMYTAFAFFYTLTIYGIARGYLEGSIAWRWTVLPLAALTITLHGLGFTVGVAMAFVGVIPHRTLPTRLAAFGSAAAAAAWFFFWDSVQGSGFVRPRTLALAADGAAAEAMGGGAEAGGPLSAITNRLYFPEDLLFASPETVVRLLLIAGIVGGIVIVLFSVWRWPDLRRPWTLLSLIACIAAAAVQQFALAAVLFAAFVVVQGRGLRAVIQPSAVVVAGFLALLFAGWFFVGISGAAGIELSVYETFRTLLDYPKAEVVRRFAEERPFVTLLAGLGMLVPVQEASVRKALTPRAFFVAAIIGSLVLHGIFESQFRPRYNFHLDTLYMTFVAFGALLIANAALDLVGEKLRSPIPATVDLVLPALFAVSIGFLGLRPIASFALVNSWEGSSPEWTRRHGLPWPVDRKSAAVYVRTHAAPDDQVLTMDWMTSYFYAGRVDYWLRSSDYVPVSVPEGGRWREMYLGALVVPDAEALTRLVDDPCRNTLWVITSGWVMLRQLHHLSPEILEIIEEIEPYRVHLGRDGISAAYRIPVSGTCRQASLITG